ncbi:hybrid sensor histidine kinase/response regulator transcription factor [Pseudobacter ginsenosidimutans]|uniref:histidine kinase n=1 Tax=Pseudobacter ginsenosidimutans TaxID=661488 RepID=A0A4Q7MZZ3_9BACT|nr:two-component regulator propeller domain-containing protein [Pseudobacter ginsenosidimutans]RZS74472.1 two component regulator with propeller domain [Pseudobacter ginsenosidimutans]
MKWTTPDRFYIRIALFLLLFAQGSNLLKAQPVQYRFNTIGLNQGLSNNRITAIIKDQQGFLWFGTAAGLNRFDGYTFKVFLHKEGDSTTINDNFIDKVVHGPLQSLWAYTPKGWNKFDPKTEKFVSRPKQFLQAIGIPHEWFSTIVPDKQGGFWFVFPHDGMYCYNATTGKTDHYNDQMGTSPLYSNNVTAIAFDSEGNYWVAYEEGVFEKRNGKDNQLMRRNKSLLQSARGNGQQYRIFIDKENDVWLYVANQKHGAWWYQPATDTVVPVNSNSVQLKLNNDIVNGIIQDHRGNIWIATDHGGINLINKKNGSVNYLYSSTGGNSNNFENAINAIFKDELGTIWMGTFKTGINYFNENKSSFLLFQHDAANGKSLPFNDVNCFAEDKKGNLWIGTNGGGLLYFNRATNTYQKYLNNPANNNSVSNNVISSLYLDKENKLWIGTYFGGLNCFDGKNFIRYRHIENDSFSLSDDSIWEIYEDSQGRLWIGTLTNGLQLFNRKEQKFYSYRTQRAYTVSTNSIIEDRSGNIWAGGSAGIELYDKHAKLIRTFTYDENNPNSLSNTTVLDILEDSSGLIWVGTRDGLNLYNPQLDKFTRYRTEDGLPHNTILRILKDHHQNLWISTPNGISNVSIIRNGSNMALQFRNYDETDGLQGRVFNDDAAFVTKAGELVFGGSNGYNIFFPPTPVTKTVHPPLVFTDLQLFNNSVETGKQYGGRIVLSETIAATRELVLRHDQNAFAIEFAALQFVDAGKIKYMYQLKGFNDTWITTDGNNRKISFTGLNPGTYTLSVRARNENGVWVPGSADLQIRILPPFWRSALAYCLYALLIIGSLLYGRYRIIRRTKMKFKKEQEDLEARRNQELNAMKIHFFTNVSHEFKTPLALIISPIEKLLQQQYPENENRQFRLIHRNARRLLNMVNELLDFRKLELSELKLNKKPGNIFRLCRDVFDSFSDIAERKTIDFTYHADEADQIMAFDADKMERILFNLLSNAFKFTPEGGAVSLQVSKIPGNEKAFIEIRVSDTGIGIPAGKLEKIFERFFQHETPSSIINQGSGIGLSICKEFVKLHGGTIHAESSLNKGSVFIVNLPVQLPEDITETAPAPVPLAHKGNNPNRKTILLVEDNEDYRFYIKDNLKEHFTVIEAANGKEGWQKALSEHPHLIISDINMPELSGIELCQKIRNDKRTSFIPFILLTVLSSEFSQLEGLGTGASDYITKPFNIELLLSKIRNLLAQQDKFRETYQKQVTVAATEIIPVSTDTEFVQKALALVEKNMSNPDFSVEELSRELLLGRPTLYKKLFSLTGQTPIEFIRSIRLQRAKQMLETEKWTIAEIAYEVGFNDPKYFTKVFREQFQVTPSAYQEMHKAQGKENKNS